ncbi:hypothetical protein HHI36_016089 [Cryptolaemus montrouzieri]|uniref:Transmembrane protein n=1 Tax=Cryptolaemus montrouzieri TaxID=559131 RepID=A0ABD2N7U1_9CUCU
MSGLDVYHCDSDKKQNVRRICISSMTDRAFNVYTEFYTHTINMCWFLRGQIWQETISENTAKVGKQLETSAIKQEKLLEIQRESLEVQEHMLRHSRLIENILSDLSEATQSHKEMLILIGQTVSNLQSWLVGEVSWVNTLIFYVSFGILVMILTSTPRTMITRLPVLILLVISIFTERVICTFILNSQDFKKSASDLYGDINDCIQLLRYFFVILSFSIVIYKAYFHEDILISSKYILDNIYKQNQIILEKFEKNNLSLPDTAYLVYKTNFTIKKIIELGILEDKWKKTL